MAQNNFKLKFGYSEKASNFSVEDFFKFFGLLRISEVYMQGLKSAILAIFQTGLGWQCTVSAALKNPSKDFKNYFCIGCRCIPSNARE